MSRDRKTRWKKLKIAEADLSKHFNGPPGKPRVDDRTVISGILHVSKTGCRWRDVPPADDHLQPLQSVVSASHLAAHFRENGGRRSRP
jgi:hypothetical protein